MKYWGLIMVTVLTAIIESYVCSASIPVCITSELSPGAQVYVPLDQVTPRKSTLKEICPSSTQSSRYSRKTVRTNTGSGDTPRPILGTKTPFPRAILGRKEYVKCDKEFSGKEYCAKNRNVHEVKISDEKSTPVRTNSCSLNCVQCKQMFGPYFQGRACGDACISSNGQLVPDCNNPGTLGGFLKRLY